MKRVFSVIMICLICLSLFLMFSMFAPKAKAESAYLTDIVQLTTSSSRDLNPSWSPDSSKIAYISDWNVWVMNNDGTSKLQLTSGYIDPAVTYSPDGRKMAFMRYVRGNDRADLMIMDSDGSNIQPITNSGLHHGQPSWSHDGTKLAFYYGGAGTNTNEIHIINADGTNEVTVLSSTYPYMNPVWSLDDSKLLYSQIDGIWLVNTFPPYTTTHLYTTTIPAADPVFSPDGKYILYSTGEISTPYSQIYRDFCLIDSNGNYIAQLTTDSTLDYPFSWSPDGQYIAFGSVRSGNDDIWRANIILPGSPVGYWKFDEGSSSYAYDSSGNGNTGTLMNNPQWVTGVSGTALGLDGQSSYVSMADSASLTITNQITISAWVKSAGIVKTDTIVRKGNGYSLYLEGGHGNVAEVAIFQGGVGKFVSGTTIITPGLWYHVAGTFDGTNLKVYVNGILEGSLTTPGGIDNQPTSEGNHNLIIGANSGLGDFFNGIIDEAKIYDYARTAQDILNDYNSVSHGPLGYWKFDEGSGNIAYDSAGTNNGVIRGVPSWTTGIVGGALSFDGAQNDYVAMSSQLDVTDAMTVEVWVYPTFDPTNPAAYPQPYGDAGRTIIRKSSCGDDTFELGFYSGYYYNQANPVPYVSAGFLQQGGGVVSLEPVYIPGLISEGQWYHLVITFQRNNYAKLYVNGVEEMSIPTLDQPLRVSSRHLTIGQEADVVGGDPLDTPYAPQTWVGKIDEAEIYNYARTSSEIQADYSAAVPRLAGYWKFDDGSGNYAYDSSGNGNTGTLVNGPQWVNGISGGGLQFNGINQYVSVGGGTDLNPHTSDWTESAWVNIAKLDTDMSVPQFIIMTQRQAASDSSLTLLVSGRTSDSTALFAFVYDAPNVIAGAASPIMNVLGWHNIVGVRRGGELYVYVDGVEYGPNNYKGLGDYPTATTDITSSSPLNFFHHDAWNKYSAGTLDEVKIYNYARTSSEILTDYSSAGFGPVGYWKFDDSSGNYASDSSGNGNDGTVYGAAWTNGVSNGALQFDGISNYVGISSSSSLALTGSQMSLELWIKPTVTLDGSLDHRINIMDKGDGYGFQMEIGDGRISFFVNIAGFGDEWLPTTTNDWVAGTWYHIVGTYDGTTEKVYVNGVMETSTPVSGSLSGYSDPLSIGSYCYGTMNFFNGAIDEVKIYNYARSAGQVAQDYQAFAASFVRAWKDDSSLGLENDRLFLHGLSETGNYRWFFDYLVYKDTGTTWYQPWGELAMLVYPNFQWNTVSTADFEVNAFTETDKAYLQYSITSGNLKEDLTYTIYPGEPYVNLTLSVTNVGSTTENTHAGAQFTTWIAGDYANDYYFVPGYGQGQFTGSSGNIYFTGATDKWVAEWDQNKGEGCGILSTKGFTPSNIVSEDFGNGEGFKFIGDNFNLDPGQSSTVYDCYYYFFTGTGWQKTNDFYARVTPAPTQYNVAFGQSGIGADFMGTVVTVDGTNYASTDLPVSFSWDANSLHTFSYASPLSVSGTEQYAWASTSGLSNVQSDTLTITASGNVVGQYTLQNAITFDQSGASSDFGGTVLTVDGTPYGVNMLPVSFSWASGSTHTYAFESLLTVSAGKQLTWTGTMGLSSAESGSITVAGYGSVVGDYKTQYYLTVQTSPSGINSPSGQGWYDAGTYASISATQYVDLVLGSSRLRFESWTTNDMTEITNSGSASTAVLVDNAKTVTANYVTQYNITFAESGIGSDFTGSAITIDGTNYPAGTIASAMFWWDASSTHTFVFQSPLTVNTNEKQYLLASTSASSPYSVSGPATVTGTYKTQYLLSFAAAPSGAGSTTPSGTNVWEDAGPLSISATASHGYSFSSWTSSTTSTTFLASGSASTTATIGGSDTITANFILTPGMWGVRLSETGLPSGTRWSVTANGYTFSTTSPTISALIPSGVYIWSVAPVSIGTGTQYTPSPSSGSMPVPAQTSLSIRFTKQYLLTMKTNFGKTSPSSGWFDSGSTVTLYATPPASNTGERYLFAQWIGIGSGSYTGSNNPANDAVTMQGPISETASWNHQYSLTVMTNGMPAPYSAGVSFGGNLVGTVNDASPFTTWFNAGTFTRVIGVSSSVAGSSGTRYSFYSWSDNVNSNPRASTQMSAPASFTAIYQTQYYLTMSANFGSTSPVSNWYPSGSTITIKANAPSAATGEQYQWVQWAGTGSGSYSGTSNPAQNGVTMQGPISETASWNHQYLLTVKTNGLPSPYSTTVWLGGNKAGSASDASPFTKWIDAGTSTGSIGLDSQTSVISGITYFFTSWNDGSTTNPRPSVVMNTARTLTASYQKQYQVVFTESGLPGGTSWSVTLDNYYKSSTTSSIIFYKPPGKYSYTISSTVGAWGSVSQSFVPNATTGTLTVTTSSSIQSVKFQASISTPNWSGYMAVSNLPNPNSTVSMVGGSWIVQTVDGTWSYSASCQWVGIGGLGDFTFNGDKDKTLIQVGTESDSQLYLTNYYAWYEILPDDKYQVHLGSGYPVKAGDKIVAEIFLQNAPTNLWNITISDSNQKWRWSGTFTFKSSMYTAEWIDEHTQTSSSSTLADFHTAQYGPDYTSFSGMDWATINGNTALIGQQTYVAQITMTNANGQVMAAPSPLTQDGTSFLVTWDRGS